MYGFGGNEYFFSWCWSDHCAGNVEFHVSFQDHNQFIDGVSVIFPNLAGWVCPDIAAESSGLPVRSDGGDVDSLSH
jgi:hypothetical protein